MAFAVVLSSCSTTEKFSIYAKPGTEIYSPGASAPAVVPASGELKMEVPSDGYYGYMLSRAPGEKTIVPFGLDCRHSSHSGTKFARAAGYVLTIAGLGALLGGGIGVLGADSNEDEESSTVFADVAAIGGASVLIGCAIGMPADSRLKQTSYKYNFAYNRKQFVIQNIPLTPLVRVDDTKDSSSDSVVSVRRKAKARVQGSPSSKSPAVTKVKRGIKDAGASVSGRYVGSGTLYKKTSVVEEYASVEVVIERVDDNKVKMQVIESGEDYFEEPLLYDVVKNKDGSYKLTIKDIHSATMKIDSKGRLKFVHDKIYIDDDMYRLAISADKD